MIYVNWPKRWAMFNIYFSCENQALNFYSVLVFIPTFGLVVFYTLFLESVFLVDFSALTYRYFSSDLLSSSNYFLRLKQMGCQV